MCCCNAATSAERGTSSRFTVARIFERLRMCSRSPARPSERSSAACATPRNAMPSATRGSGNSSARSRRRSSSGLAADHSPSLMPSPARALPSTPETQISSPGRAASRRSARAGGTSPNTVMLMLTAGEPVVSPPINSQSNLRAISKRPLAERLEPRLVGTRQGQRQREGARLGAHRGEIRQVHGQGLVAECVGRDIGEKMTAFHQHVGGDGELLAAAGTEQRAVIADAERRLWPCHS